MRWIVALKTLCLMLPMLATQSAAGQPAATDLRRIQYKPVSTLLANPGIGWMVRPSQVPRFPNSVYYLRLDWMQLEPEDGVYNWMPIEKALTLAERNHATIGMRIMTANAHSMGEYSSPKWLFDAGCKGFEYSNDGTDWAQGGVPQSRIEPDYSDPIYLAKHAAFLKAFGERYDHNPLFEFLDIGSYGIWGEWHTPHPASVEVRRQIIDMYLENFADIPLVYMSDDAELMPYALAHGAGLRRDGVGSPWHAERWAGTPAYANVPAMGDAWKHAPIVFEWYLYYSYMKQHGWSIKDGVDFMLHNHVSLINDNIGELPPEVMPLMERLARRAGYRFLLRELSLPKTVHPGDNLELTMQWENAGVAKLYRAFDLQVELRNSSGNTVAQSVVEADLTEWLPGPHAARTLLKVPAELPAGEYKLTVAMLDHAGQRPALKLAMDAPEQDGRYTVASVEIK